MLIFLIGVGPRLGTALELDWQHVHLAMARAFLWHGKTESETSAEMPPRVVAALAALPHRTGPVFRRPDGQPYCAKVNSGGQIKTAFNAAVRRAGIARATPHTCRHTFATWHYSVHSDILALKRAGPWKSFEMVERYTHLALPEMAPQIIRNGWATNLTPYKIRAESVQSL